MPTNRHWLNEIPRPRRRPDDLGTRAPEPTTPQTAEEMAQTPGGGNSMLRDLIAEGYEGVYDRTHAPPDHLGDAYRVEQGQLTFDAEGQEGGPYHSRKPHVPGVGASGVTVGRGYDIGQHSAAQTVEALTGAGVSEEQAAAYSGAAGKKRRAAVNWLDTYGHTLEELTPEQQKALFEVTYDEMLADVKRISSKPSTVRAYGEVDFENMDPALRDILVDLRYRGDYTPRTRKDVQPLAAGNDLEGMAEHMADRDAWSQVPEDRFKRRRDYIAEALEERRLEEQFRERYPGPAMPDDLDLLQDFLDDMSPTGGRASMS